MTEDREVLHRLAQAARRLAYAVERLEWVAWAFDPVNGPYAESFNYEYAATQGAELLTRVLPDAEAEFRAALAAL